MLDDVRVVEKGQLAMELGVVMTHQNFENIAGPHHVHPSGEIDLIMPIDGAAQFDGRPAGWLVCPPGSAHKPTVSNGRALVLYLLPNGAIEFTQQ